MEAHDQLPFRHATVRRASVGERPAARCAGTSPETAPMASAAATPDAGQILVGEMDVTAPRTPLGEIRTRIGMVFQRFNLFPHMTALDNVALAPKVVLGWPAERAAQEARAQLARVGLADLAARSPATLSGGQQQRVAIARALAMQPEVMLFDEPTSALDPELVHEVLGVMLELSQAGMTLLVVTHEMRFARQAAQQVVFLDEGVIKEEGPPGRVLSAPSSPRLRAFLGRVGVDS